MKKFLVAVPAIFASTAAFAQDCGSKLVCDATSVPEISALQGTAALAAVAAVVLLAWERSRRAA